MFQNVSRTHEYVCCIIQMLQAVLRLGRARSYPLRGRMPPKYRQARRVTNMFHAIPYNLASRGTQAEMGKHLNADGEKWEKKKREKRKSAAPEFIILLLMVYRVFAFFNWPVISMR